MNIPESRKDIPIQECFEPLIGIPTDGRFVFTHPHPYEILGAPYEKNESPFRLRESVLQSLEEAAKLLYGKHPGYKLRIFDAYRPFVVQKFMVDYTAQEYCKRVHKIAFEKANETIQQESLDYALQIFAKPDTNPTNPPPHSTGAAIDLTIVDERWIDLPMGSEIDEVENAHPDAFKDSLDPKEQFFHKNRMLLKRIMEQAGFVQLLSEWWHFSQGDQNAVLIRIKTQAKLGTVIPSFQIAAKYGRI